MDKVEVNFAEMLLALLLAAAIGGAGAAVAYEAKIVEGPLTARGKVFVCKEVVHE